jgi:hypothetical protein
MFRLGGKHVRHPIAEDFELRPTSIALVFSQLDDGERQGVSQLCIDSTPGIQLLSYASRDPRGA